MKIPYFCCIGAELKRYAKDFDFMNQVYLYKVPTDDTIDEVFAQDYFKAISDTVLQDDILYVYETDEQMLHTCRFDKANGHITAVKLESNIPELEPDRILVSDHNGKIAAGDLSLEYIKDTLSILHCTATLSSTVDTTTVVMLDELEAFANLDSRPSYKAAGALVIDGNGSRGIIDSVDTENETATIVTTYVWPDLTTKANTALDNLTSVGKNISNWSSNVTNCITEIPQDIKLELNDGILTLKAGSKAYIPNGAGVFTPITITTDKSTQFASNGPRFAYVRQDGALYVADGLDHSVSGAIDPLAGIPWHVWYDTTNNILYRYGESGTTPIAQNFSLPIAIVTVTNGAISSIDKVFNGFGYIGSIVFTLPGLKALYPKGRNADGTLKNGNVICNSVQISSNYNYDEEHVVILQTNGKVGWYSRANYIYDKENNYIYNANTGIRLDSCVVGTFSVVNSAVQNFKPFDAFRALDYNDTEFIAQQSAPSDRYIDLTLGNDGDTYKVPADGFVFLSKKSTAAGQLVFLINDTASKIRVYSVSTGSGQDIGSYIPVKKGDVVRVYYNVAGATSYFRFVYADGSK